MLEVGNDGKFIDGNIYHIDENSEKVFLRANADVKPEYVTLTIDGVTYKAVKVADKIYISDCKQSV